MRIAVIPARGGSKRIKKKNIIDFCGRPMIDYSLRAARRSNLFDVIHVSTEDPEIRSCVEACGVEIDFMRDPALSDDRTPLAPVIRWTLEEYDRRGRHFDEICLLMPTAPLIQSQDLVDAYQRFASHGGSTPVLAVSTFPVPIEWAFRRDGEILRAISPDKLEIRSQDLEKCYYDSGMFFFAPRAQFELDPPSLGSTFVPYELPRTRSVDIDDADDLALAECLFRGTLRTESGE